jgi:nitrogen regulatory protein P-II 1
MKKIETVIRPENFDEIKTALEEAGYPDITVTEIKSHNNQMGVTQIYRGREYKAPQSMLKLEVVTPGDDQAVKMVEAAMKIASIKNLGEGKVFVFEVAET